MGYRLVRSEEYNAWNFLLHATVVDWKLVTFTVVNILLYVVPETSIHFPVFSLSANISVLRTCSHDRRHRRDAPSVTVVGKNLRTENCHKGAEAVVIFFDKRFLDNL